MHTRRWIGVGVGVVVVGALLGASRAPLERGPLADTQARTLSCLPTQLSDIDSFGAANWNNPTDEPLTIDSVTLVDGDGLTLVGAMTLPNPGDGHGGGVGAGAVRGYPLVDDPATGYTLDFSGQQTVPGAVLAPGVPTDLVIGVQRSADTVGRSSAVRVAYHSPRVSYLFDIPASYALPAETDDCPSMSDD